MACSARTEACRIPNVCSSWIHWQSMKSLFFMPLKLRIERELIRIGFSPYSW